MPDNLSVINKFQSVIAVCFFIVFCIYFMPAPDHAIRVHDTFDGNFTSRHVLIHSGHFFDLNPTTIVPGIMNGLPRGVFSAFTELNALLMYFFGSLCGFTIAFLIVHVTGFLGMYLFGKDHLPINPDQRGLLILISVAFACLPVFVIQSLTVTGVPLLMWAFYNLLKEKKIKLSFLVFFFFGLWSQLVLVGFHIILVTGALALCYSVINKKVQWRLFGAISLLGIVYILSNYMLFYLHGFDPSYQSARAEFEKELGLNFNGVIGTTFLEFFRGDYSTANYFGYLFIPLLGYYVFVLFKERGQGNNNSIGLTTLLVVLCSAFLISLLDWKGMAGFYKSFSFANVFNFKRFTNILPAFFCMLLMAAAFKFSALPGSTAQLILTGFLLVFLVFIWRGNISHNNSGFNNTGLTIEREEASTFNEFFDPALYSHIKKEMGADTIANVIHFGVSPSPSKLAGLNVLDDYQSDYPRAYKQDFRKIIEGELNKSKELKNYFDNWGARCYLYSANGYDGHLEEKNGLQYEQELSVNVNQMKLMNCRYIISAILIGNSKKLGLELKKVFVGTSVHNVRLLYKIV